MSTLRDKILTMSGGGSTNRANRPSPSASATAYPVGHEMVGNDGNWYIIAADKNGTHRWQKTNKSVPVQQAKSVTTAIKNTAAKTKIEKLVDESATPPAEPTEAPAPPAAPKAARVSSGEGKDKTQDIIDAFIVKNAENISNIAKTKPAFHSAVLNALNFLSGRFGTGEAVDVPVVEKAVDPYSLKVGDFFKGVDKSKNSTEGLVFFEIKKIDQPNVFVDILSITGQRTKDVDLFYDGTMQKIREGDWIKIDSLPIFSSAHVAITPIKVGDVFRTQDSKSGNEYYIIVMKMVDKENMIVDIVNNNNYRTEDVDYKIEQANEKIQNGIWVKVPSLPIIGVTETKNSSLPFKVGDKYYYKIDPKKIYTIERITSTNVLVSWRNAPNSTQLDMDMPLNIVLNSFSNGDCVLVSSKYHIEVGQEFKDKNIKNNLKITDINNGIVTVKYEDGLVSTYAMQSVEKKIENGNWSPIRGTVVAPTMEVNLVNVGDKFNHKDTPFPADTFTIVRIENGDVVTLMHGVENSYSIQAVNKFITNGTWISAKVTPVSTTSKFSIGEIFMQVSSQRNFEIKDIQRVITLVSMDAAQEVVSIPEAVLTSWLNNGVWEGVGIVSNQPANLFKVGDFIWNKQAGGVMKIGADIKDGLFTLIEYDGRAYMDGLEPSKINIRIKNDQWVIYPVKVGDKLIHKSQPTVIFEVDELRKNEIGMKYLSRSGALPLQSFSLTDLINGLKNGDWKILGAAPTTRLSDSLKVGDKLIRHSKFDNADVPIEIVSIIEATTITYKIVSSGTRMVIPRDSVDTNLADGTWRPDTSSPTTKPTHPTRPTPPAPSSAKKSISQLIQEVDDAENEDDEEDDDVFEETTGAGIPIEKQTKEQLKETIKDLQDLKDLGIDDAHSNDLLASAKKRLRTLK